MNKRSFYLVSLGCAKNTVDSESMASLLQMQGYTPTDRQAQAGILIVNTCGFIKPARDESIDVLRDLARTKKRGQTLIAAGCLTERYRQWVAEQVPGIDGILGTRRWMDIVGVVQSLRGGSSYLVPQYHLPDESLPAIEPEGVMRAALQGTSAYLKIADGCRRPCAFCAIPLIKGTAVSRPVKVILDEARQLRDMGIQELILIAQDTTDYGSDLGMKDGLAQLLEQLTLTVPDLPWIRVMYAYPGFVTDRLIDVMASSHQILPYLDIPLQHADPEMLKRMRRPSDMDWVYRTLAKMRSAVPHLALRTTFIVGFPGETEVEFQSLLDFIQEIKFDHAGAFTYSMEQGTTAEPLGDPLPQEVKDERLERLMLAQQAISLAKNQAFIGKTLDVLIEGMDQGISIGRSYRDAPEIDGMTIVEGEAPIGEIVSVKITGAMAHDLTGQLA